MTQSRVMAQDIANFSACSVLILLDDFFSQYQKTFTEKIFFLFSKYRACRKKIITSQSIEDMLASFNFLLENAGEKLKNKFYAFLLEQNIIYVEKNKIYEQTRKDLIEDYEERKKRCHKNISDKHEEHYSKWPSWSLEAFERDCNYHVGIIKQEKEEKTHPLNTIYFSIFNQANIKLISEQISLHSATIKNAKARAEILLAWDKDMAQHNKNGNLLMLIPLILQYEDQAFPKEDYYRLLEKM